MDIARLIDALSRPEAYPHPVDTIQVVQTHISVVFLTGSSVYKIKKPVRMGFLDFSTLERRHHFCQRELILNRRLAPSVYLDFVTITRQNDTLRIGGDGPAVEWAVHMHQLPENANLLSHLESGTLHPSMLEALGQRIAAFHALAHRDLNLADLGRAETVLNNALENFSQSRGAIGVTIHPQVFQRLEELTRQLGESHRLLMDRRVAEGRIRDTHGDLRLDHVYWLPDSAPPDDITIIDCIEFNDAFRYADTVADIAFLAMDLGYRGRQDLADRLMQAYFRHADDPEGTKLLAFYVAYRSAVRAKVDGFQMAEKEIPEAHRVAAAAKARAHWLFALATLEAPANKPCLVCVGGLPGTGKSVLAKGLASFANFEVLRTDVIRKELAASATGSPAGDLYTTQMTDAVYGECLGRAAELLFAGRRVMVDANFPLHTQRQSMAEVARSLGVPFCFLHCQVPEEVALNRISKRTRDASDADQQVYHRQAKRWVALQPDELARADTLNTHCPVDEMVQTGLAILRQRGLA
jgi:aminoglycoside phosphotransferase family enzyme/predicted kinase